MVAVRAPAQMERDSAQVGIGCCYLLGPKARQPTKAGDAVSEQRSKWFLATAAGPVYINGIRIIVVTAVFRTGLLQEQHQAFPIRCIAHPFRCLARSGLLNWWWFPTQVLGNGTHVCTCSREQRPFPTRKRKHFGPAVTKPQTDRVLHSRLGPIDG